MPPRLNALLPLPSPRCVCSAVPLEGEGAQETSLRDTEDLRLRQRVHESTNLQVKDRGRELGHSFDLTNFSVQPPP